MVTVNLNGFNGSICNIGWDVNDASVLCRMLGISDVGYPVNNQAFGPANGVTLLRDVSCDGNETDIMSCDRNDIGTKLGCSNGNDAGVICGPTEGIRLNYFITEYTASLCRYLNHDVFFQHVLLADRPGIMAASK